jgi:hypothetical protein
MTEEAYWRSGVRRVVMRFTLRQQKSERFACRDSRGVGRRNDRARADAWEALQTVQALRQARARKVRGRLRRA